MKFMSSADVIGALKTTKNILGTLANRSSKAANAGGGIMSGIRHGLFDGAYDTVRNAHRQALKGDIDIGKALKAGFMEGDNIRWGRVAGTASALGIGYRFLSGGGVYRDKNGNFDIAGVPFI